jgi:N-acetylneuraminate synthase
MKECFEKLIIFELANNHQGSVEHAKYIVSKVAEEAMRRGINAAVKFQYRDLDSFIHPAFRDRKDVKHIPRFLSTRLTAAQFQELVRATKDCGLLTVCTPFDETSVSLCMDHGIDLIKIASCSADDWPLLEEVALTKKPVIISTGGCTFSQMDNIYSFFTHRNTRFAMLHCIGEYPPSDQQMQLSTIDRMISRYPGVPIGYSGHENPQDFSISQMAVAKGACILERHVGHAEEGIALNTYSTEADTVGDWLDAVKRAWTICEVGRDRRIDPTERKSLAELARGVYLAKEMKSGAEISRDDVYFAMPVQPGQMTSGQFREGIPADKDYASDEPLSIKTVQENSEYTQARAILHEVKGMLNEAKIFAGNDFTIELSHHFGIAHFRHYGITMINIVNREYCKKLIIVLPGQKHPKHYHVQKEETFQVLSGNLLINIDDQELEIKQGELFTVERNVIHAFESLDGCIFEEISTTHVKNDSFYADPKIRSLDPMERKTILESW